MQTNGKNLPVKSAKPATAPDGSCVGVSETKKAVPLVPSEITKSPLLAPTPNAAPALSPAPGAIGIPSVVVAAKSSKAAIFGKAISRLSRSAMASKSL